MANVLERLLLRVEADTDRLRRGLRVGERQTQRSASRMERAFARARNGAERFVKAVFSIRGAAAAVGAATGLGFAIKRSLEFADTIAKTADRIGIGTDALQEYRLAADLSGIAQEKLDQGLEAFSKRLGEARNGTGTLLTFLNKMPKSFREQVLGVGSVDEALSLLLGKMASLENQQDRTALSAAAFSRTAGVQMANLVRGGIRELEAMRAKARELGLVIDEDLLRSSEDAVDQITLLGKVIKTNLVRAVVSSAPQIAGLLEGLVEQLPDAIRQVETLAARFGLIGSVSERTRIANLREELAALQADLRALRDEDLFTLPRLGTLFGTAEEGSLAEMLGVETLEARIARVAGALRQALTDRALRTASEQVAQQYRLAALEAGELRDNTAEAAEEADRLASKAERLSERFKAPGKRLREELEDIRKLADEGQIGRGVAQRAARAAFERFESAGGNVRLFAAENPELFGRRAKGFAPQGRRPAGEQPRQEIVDDPERRFKGLPPPGIGPEVRTHMGRQRIEMPNGTVVLPGGATIKVEGARARPDIPAGASVKTFAGGGVMTVKVEPAVEVDAREAGRGIDTRVREGVREGIDEATPGIVREVLERLREREAP